MTTTRSMPVGTGSPGRASIPARTLRKDNWWRAPLVTFILLAAWVIYATVRVFFQSAYFAPSEHYLSPFYSPCVTSSCQNGSAELGTWFGHFPIIIPYAIITLPFLLGFRLSCYYYRKAYYRAFWLSPPACAVAEPHGSYSGETRFPLIVQNAHRYFWMVAALISILNTWDLIQAFRPEGHAFGFGLGTFVMLVNVAMLWLYTLGCHSCRHITAGRLNHFSKHPVRYRAWTWVSWMNARHMQFAWASLATLALTDGYIALVAAKIIVDPHVSF